MAIVDGQIRCNRCGALKPASEFCPAFAKCGSGYCRPCARARAKARYPKDRDKAIARAKARYALKAEEIKAKARDRYARDPEKNRAKTRAYYERNAEKVKTAEKARKLERYGLTPLEYDAILAKQGGACAICGAKGAKAGGRAARLAVDHCHATGIVRGLLCHTCNLSIGQLGDTAELLQRASEYLIRAAQLAERRVA